MFRWIVSYIVLSHYLQLSYSMTSRIIPRALSEVSTTSPKQFKVAVIGAGAAGLVTARALSSKHGIQVTVLEKNKNVGGVWAYEKSKHRPMYKNLRTNLPKEIMAFREFPFNSDTNVKSPSFVTHKDVQRYLMSYCNKFDLEKLIQFGSQVEQLRICVEHKSSIVEEWPQIELAWVQNGTRHSQTFDAVCVCNGHYAAPSIPTIQGIEYFKGETLHSIEYDDPLDFAGKTVLCIGGRASGADIAREISAHAKKVYLSDSTCPEPLVDGQPHKQGNVLWVPRTEAINRDSTIVFQRCSETPQVDTIIYCTGYDYKFPFINEKSNLELSVVPGERRVSPLYDQLWHAYYPNLTFIGLQHSIVPFPFFELQAEAIVSQWIESSDWKLPNLEERLLSAKQDSNSGGPNGTRIQDTHFLGSFQWNSCLHYAKCAGILDQDLEDYIATNKAIYDDSNRNRKALFPGGDDSYRNMKYIRQDSKRSFQVEIITNDTVSL